MIEPEHVIHRPRSVKAQSPQTKCIRASTHQLTKRPDGGKRYAALGEICSIEEDADRKDSLVYHYTAAEGLRGIIEDGCIWATNVNYLNDYAEYQHGLSIIREEIENLRIKEKALEDAGIEPSRFNRELARGLIISQVQQQLRTYDHSQITFIASFFDAPDSSRGPATVDPGDNLSQWRAYSRDTQGYSIGFDKRILENHVSAIDPRRSSIWTVCGSCSYNPDSKRAIASRIPSALEATLPEFLGAGWLDFWAKANLEFTLNGPGRTSHERVKEIVESAMGKFRAKGDSNEIERRLNETYRHFIGEFMVQPALMKHHSFESEKEWRIVRFNADFKGIDFRTTKSGLIPFVKIPTTDPTSQAIMKGMINRIVVGPQGSVSSRQQGSAIAAVKSLLLKHHIDEECAASPDGVTIDSSRIPFRT
jgi:hypothetical protein